MERCSSRLSNRSISRNSPRNSSANALVSPDQIRVVVRLRPFEGTSCVKSVQPDSIEIEGLNQPFTFDNVFGTNSTQEEVFNLAVKPSIEGVLQGYNGCVLAYGQTGAGKSHTMMGPSGSEHSSDKGVIPRMVEYLFDNLPNDHSVKVGFLEIYNEKVRDLLGDNQDLKVHDIAGGGGFYVKGLNEVSVACAEEVYQIMHKGDKNRSVAATNMNSRSSRSHSVFLVDVEGPKTRAKLVLVDLAGSEKVAKTGARGTLLEEAASINKSLSALGMVVNALSSESPQHVPFRDSKLTRILQDSLAGNSRTCLILHCSPSIVHTSETVSTLRFGTRAKEVKTLPRMNIQLKEISQADFETHRELNMFLETQRDFLIELTDRDRQRYVRQRSQIEALTVQLMSYESKAKKDESYITGKLWGLESRVAQLCGSNTDSGSD